MFWTQLSVIIIFCSSVLTVPAVVPGREADVKDERDIEDFMAAVEDVLTGAISNVSTALAETGALDNSSSILDSAIGAFTDFWTSEDSPVQQLFSVVDSYTQYLYSFFVSEKSGRSGAVAVLGYGVTVLVILASIFPVIYISSYLAGKYIIAPLVLNPFQSRGDFGRSLEDYQMLDTLSAGVMKALETYNLLQSLNGDL